MIDFVPWPDIRKRSHAFISCHESCGLYSSPAYNNSNCLWPLAGRYINCHALPYLNNGHRWITAMRISWAEPSGSLLTITDFICYSSDIKTLRHTKGWWMDRQAGRAAFMRNPTNTGPLNKCNSILSTLWLKFFSCNTVLHHSSIFSLVWFDIWWYIYTIYTEVCCVYNNTLIQSYSVAKECTEFIYIQNYFKLVKNFFFIFIKYNWSSIASLLSTKDGLTTKTTALTWWIKHLINS